MIRNNPEPPFERKESAAHRKAKVRIAHVVDSYYSQFGRAETLYEYRLSPVLIQRTGQWITFWADVYCEIWQGSKYLQITFEVDDPSHDSKYKSKVKDPERDYALLTQLKVPVIRFDMEWTNGRRKTLRKPLLTPYTEQEIIDMVPKVTDESPWRNLRDMITLE